MHIALVSTCALCTPPRGYGGTELVVAELAKGLEQLGHDVMVFATGDSSPHGQLRHTFEHPIWPPNDLAEARHAGAAFQDIARGAFDVVHVNHAAALPFAAWTHKPVVATIHHAREDALVQHYLAYPNVHLVSISDRQAELCPELSFARTVHHGLDPALYPAGPGGDGVAFVGRFAKEKGTHHALEAACAAGVRIRLGGAAHEEGRAYFETEVQPRLQRCGALAEWMGELSHEPKLELLQNSRALLMPIEWEEPFGLVMIEAMLVGTPVIAFARGSAPEVVEDGVTGFIVRDVHEMEDRIRKVGSLDRTRCRERALERWTSVRMARDYLDLYESLVRTEAAGANVISFSEAEARMRPSRLPTAGDAEEIYDGSETR